MSTEVAGHAAYELIYKDDLPLTDAQAEALAAEYAKLGLRYEKCTWKGANCIVTKASAAEFKQFCEKKSANWQSIRERVGYGGLLNAKNNTYNPGTTFFSPGSDWNDVVALIDAKFSSTSRTAAPTPCPRPGRTPVPTTRQNKKSWWQFWKKETGYVYTSPNSLPDKGHPVICFSCGRFFDGHGPLYVDSSDASIWFCPREECIKKIRTTFADKCAWCNKPFTSANSGVAGDSLGEMYCDDTCRKKAGRSIFDFRMLTGTNL